MHPARRPRHHGRFSKASDIRISQSLIHVQKALVTKEDPMCMRKILGTMFSLITSVGTMCATLLQYLYRVGAVVQMYACDGFWCVVLAATMNVGGPSRYVALCSLPSLQVPSRVQSVAFMVFMDATSLGPLVLLVSGTSTRKRGTSGHWCSQPRCT